MNIDVPDSGARCNEVVHDSTIVSPNCIGWRQSSKPWLAISGAEHTRSLRAMSTFVVAGVMYAGVCVP